MMVRARIIVIGRVQKAGYKDTVDEIAFHLNLKGYVKNLDDGTVEVVCEGEKKDIEELAEKVRVREYPIFVDSVKVEYLKATGEFKQFDIIREKDITEATYERMDAAARYMRNMNKNLGEKIENVGEKTENLGEKIENVGEKTENLGEKIENVGEKTENLGEKIENVGEDIGGKIGAIGENLGEKIDSMHHNLKDGQNQMIGKQDSMLGKQDKMLDGQSAMHGDIKDLRDITRDSFTDLKDTYGVFHKTMGSMQEELISTRKELSKLVDYIGVLVKEHIQKTEK